MLQTKTERQSQQQRELQERARGEGEERGRQHAFTASPEKGRSASRGKSPTSSGGGNFFGSIFGSKSPTRAVQKSDSVSAGGYSASNFWETAFGGGGGQSGGEEARRPPKLVISGMRVQAKWRNLMYCFGTVMEVREKEGVCDVRYDDGDFEANMRFDRVQEGMHIQWGGTRGACIREL